ncbi:hypothetical protein HIM_00850 [Hirsutella minnesotensis 3608]|nr:hypothetical protein HIM_00850 [Hirsutella minnesotensis 3608]
MQGPMQLAVLALCLGLGVDLGEAVGSPPRRPVSKPLSGPLASLGVHVRVPLKAPAANHKVPVTFGNKPPAAAAPVAGTSSGAGGVTPLRNTGMAPPNAPRRSPLGGAGAAPPPAAQPKPAWQRGPQAPKVQGSPLNRAGASAPPPAGPASNANAGARHGPGGPQQRRNFMEGVRITLFGQAKPVDQRTAAEKKLDSLAASYVSLPEDKAIILESNMRDLVKAYLSDVKGKASEPMKENLLLSGFTFMDRFIDSDVSGIQPY